MSQSIEGFLKSQQGNSQVSSQGQFTLNQQRAIELLGQYQLPEPRAYILKLVQWAVASKPSTIVINTGGGRVVVRHDGVPVENERIGELMGGSASTLDHLARGIYGAFGLKPKEVTLSNEAMSFHLLSGRTSEATFSPFPQAVELEGLPKKLFERSPMVRETLRSQYDHVDLEGPLQRLILDSTGLTGIEASLVRWVAAFAPVPISLNGRCINRPFAGMPMSFTVKNDTMEMVPRAVRTSPCAIHLCEGENYLLAPSCGYSGLQFHWFNEGTTCSSSDGSNADTPFVFNHHGLKRAELLSYHYKGANLDERDFVFVQDGVVVDQITDSVPGKVLCLVEASWAQISATGFGVVRNEHFHQRMTRIRSLVDASHATLVG